MKIFSCNFLLSGKMWLTTGSAVIQAPHEDKRLIPQPLAPSKAVDSDGSVFIRKLASQNSDRNFKILATSSDGSLK
jgi:hypothetical protein